MKKKILSLLLCAVMLTASLTACSGSNQTQTETSEQTTTEESAQTEETAEESTEETATAEETNLIIPSASCVSNLNPLLETYKEGVIMLNPLYDPLFIKDVDETRYYLAESYEVSEDGTVVTLKLKDGLKWHDGEAITADDVIFTLDVNADTNNGAGNTNACLLYTSKIPVI